MPTGIAVVEVVDEGASVVDVGAAVVDVDGSGDDVGSDSPADPAVHAATANAAPAASTRHTALRSDR
jgi:hypothetical protein